MEPSVWKSRPTRYSNDGRNGVRSTAAGPTTTRTALLPFTPFPTPSPSSSPIRAQKSLCGLPEIGVVAIGLAAGHHLHSRLPTLPGALVCPAELTTARCQSHDDTLSNGTQAAFQKATQTSRDVPTAGCIWLAFARADNLHSTYA
jgi:hypothetical protein